MNKFLQKPIAHRGLHDPKNPENSLEAFKRAIDFSYPIELDVHLVKDKGIVVFHDHNLKRMTGHDVLVKDLSLSELKEYKLLNTSSHIPSLKEVLDFVDGRVPLLIEIKKQGQVKDTIMILLDLLKDYKGDFALQSFYPNYLYYLKRLAPKIKRGQLATCNFPESTLFLQKIISKNMLLNFLIKPDFVTYDYTCIPQKKLSNFRKKKGPIIAYTITSPDIEKVTRAHVDNIIFEHYIPKED